MIARFFWKQEPKIVNDGNVSLKKKVGISAKDLKLPKPATSSVIVKKQENPLKIFGSPQSLLKHAVEQQKHTQTTIHKPKIGLYHNPGFFNPLNPKLVFKFKKF